MKVEWDMIQGSDEWLLARKGKVTASILDKIITSKTGELSKQSDDLINELIEEAFFPTLNAWQGNYWMQWGKQFEDEAREAFMAETLFDVRTVGFVHGSIGPCGCSPDGLILSDAGIPISGVEIKCPRPKTHVGYVRAGGLPDEYRQQCHGSMAMTGLRDWHFWSFVKGWRPHHVIVKWDSYTDKVRAALDKFMDQYKTARKEALPKLQISL